MLKTLQIRLTLEEEAVEGQLKRRVAAYLGLNEAEFELAILRKSIDARKPEVVFNYKLAAYVGENAPKTDYTFDYKDVSSAPEIHIIGFGPAGMWAALRCLELGFKPIVFERGKDVKERRRDLRAINQHHTVNENSNYCFGEGGAGTYSDGKLYTRSLKRGDVKRIFHSLVHHGATEQILIDAHPHIGTNKLPKVVKNIRETIIKYGGEVHFNVQLTDLIIKNQSVQAVVLNNSEELPVQRVILATGHSARDVFQLLDKKKIDIQAKSFAMAYGQNTLSTLSIPFNIIVMETETNCFLPHRTVWYTK